MKKLNLVVFLFAFGAFAQDVTETFHSTRIVNAHSAEILGKRLWEYRIEHRFGDVAGTNGGPTAGFGFDNAADIRFAFEHGFAKNWMLGFARLKGVGGKYPSSLLEGFVKGRLLTQNKEKKMPFSLAILGETYYSYQKATSGPMDVTAFPESVHRLSYASQLILTRKFSDRLSVALIPSYVHRNYVAADDVNDLFSLGGAVNMKLTKSFGLILEYFQNFEPESGLNMRTMAKNSLGIGMEFTTNGHNFTITLTNARGFGAVQYIAMNEMDWTKGQFRLGFSISRSFKIRRK